MDKKFYLEHKGVRCPFCQSYNIDTVESVQHNEYDPGTYTQLIECYDCGEEWEDILTLTDVRKP